MPKLNLLGASAAPLRPTSEADPSRSSGAATDSDRSDPATLSGTIAIDLISSAFTLESGNDADSMRRHCAAKLGVTVNAVQLFELREVQNACDNAQVAGCRRLGVAVRDSGETHALSS